MCDVRLVPAQDNSSVEYLEVALANTPAGPFVLGDSFALC